MAAVVMDDLVEEILLRFPLDDPASLIRAALICKAWCRLVSDAGFHRRFRELHHAPPMLGLLCNCVHTGARFSDILSACFIPTYPCRHRRDSFYPRRASSAGWQVLDSRHGRVLLHGVLDEEETTQISTMILWDPITNEQVELPNPPISTMIQRDPITGEETTLPSLLPDLYRYGCGWNAAVLCATCGDSGRNRHEYCHHGPFLVVLMGKGRMPSLTFVHVYSLESGAWSAMTTATTTHGYLRSKHSVLAGNALYFVSFGRMILEYNLTTREIFETDLPATVTSTKRIVLTADKDGGLGLAEAVGSQLYLWSREAASLHKDAGWTQSRVIELGTLLPLGPLSASPHLIGFAMDGDGVIFVSTKHGVFSIDQNSDQVVKLEGFGTDDYNDILNVFVHVSFYTPVSKCIFA